MLADNIFERTIRPTVEAFVNKTVGARIVLAEIAEPEHLRHLGVPELDREGRVTRIVEKPDRPPSNYCVTGVYCYDSTVFSVIADLVPSARGELEITDVNNHFVSIVPWPMTWLMDFGVMPGSRSMRITRSTIS